jgi:hypothetical protein
LSFPVCFSILTFVLCFALKIKIHSVRDGVCC